MDKAALGIIGLGVMGKNLALNIVDKGHALSVYNRTDQGEENIVSEFINTSSKTGLKGYTSLPFFVASLERPRKVLLMIKAGPAVDQLIDSLAPLLATGDIIVDGGNSHFKDTRSRCSKLAEKGIHFIGCGISGGSAGARTGPSLMPGGSKESYELVSSILEAIAAKDKSGKPCCSYLGPDGSGHFVKMVHNGIEYAEMQLLAEIYQLLRQKLGNNEIAAVFDSWNQGELASYLLKISSTILRKTENNKHLIDLILDKADNKGTGSWSSQAALQLGMPATLMSEAVFARYVSSLKKSRLKLDQSSNRMKGLTATLDGIQNAYSFARIINHQQSFALLAQASSRYDWQLNVSEIARIWSNGSIIRSSLMESLIDTLKNAKNIFNQSSHLQQLKELEKSVAETLSTCIISGIAVPAISSSYQYWLGMSTAQSPANLIQAQRDYFGAHTYQRTDEDASQFFHTHWDS